jgi:hypothetical protein
MEMKYAILCLTLLFSWSSAEASYLTDLIRTDCINYPELMPQGIIFLEQIEKDGLKHELDITDKWKMISAQAEARDIRHELEQRQLFLAVRQVLKKYGIHCDQLGGTGPLRVMGEETPRAPGYAETQELYIAYPILTGDRYAGQWILFNDHWPAPANRQVNTEEVIKFLVKVGLKQREVP